MAAIERGEVWWANLPEPRGSEPGFRRPVMVIQSDAYNRSPIKTILVAGITGNLGLKDAPGNVLVSKDVSGLPRDSVVNVSQILSLDRRYFAECVGVLSSEIIARVNAGLRRVMDLEK